MIIKKTNVYLGFREAKLCRQFSSLDPDEVLVAGEFILEASQLFAGEHRSCTLRSVKVQRLGEYQLLELTA